jgi:hypothetical protein
MVLGGGSRPPKNPNLVLGGGSGFEIFHGPKWGARGGSRPPKGPKLGATGGIFCCELPPPPSRNNPRNS